MRILGRQGVLTKHQLYRFGVLEPSYTQSAFMMRWRGANSATVTGRIAWEGITADGTASIIIGLSYLATH